jgi:exodeoxyribonuclease VII large subunit
MNDGMTEKITLSELQLVIRDSLYMSFPDMYWVIAEISEIKENHNGHCYLELVEKHPDGFNVKARVKAVIWCRKYSFLKSFFESSTGESLKEGLKVLVRVKIDYHELYGLSLVICDIDPSYTLGDMAIKRQLIIRRLEEEGVFDMNREIAHPVTFQRIAVISSSNAAGYTDFINHLTSNPQGYVFYTRLFESPMQGVETENGIIAALDRISAYEQYFDAVVIIRGGGSQVDLSWFDNYNIAYHITQFPLPVLTGIGHEKDQSVADLVAFRALKTPTAVADYILEHTAGIENSLVEMSVRLRDLALEITREYRNRIESVAIKLYPVSRVLLSESTDIINGKTIRLVNAGKEYTRNANLVTSGSLSKLLNATNLYFRTKDSFFKTSGLSLKMNTIRLIQVRKSDISVLEKTLEILKPENVLQRGYTITYKNGEIVKSSKQLEENDLIETRFVDGKVRSKVSETKQDQI